MPVRTSICMYVYTYNLYLYIYIYACMYIALLYRSYIYTCIKDVVPKILSSGLHDVSCCSSTAECACRYVQCRSANVTHMDYSMHLIDCGSFMNRESFRMAIVFRAGCLGLDIVPACVVFYGYRCIYTSILNSSIMRPCISIGPEVPCSLVWCVAGGGIQLRQLPPLETPLPEEEEWCLLGSS